MKKIKMNNAYVAGIRQDNKDLHEYIDIRTVKESKNDTIQEIKRINTELPNIKFDAPIVRIVEIKLVEGRTYESESTLRSFGVY